ncbi:MAG TPA: nucleotidyl transferase AbiEii/AbiGii toxin family protein [Micromonospora sp.]
MSRRAALDHVLGLVAGAPCGESLVLRGSMTMLAWVGDRARPPGDLDWVVRPPAGVPVDDLSPYPFVDRLDPVRLWPAVAHGAGRYQIWTFEEYDTGGFAPRVPPEGLHWVTAEELCCVDRPHLDVLDLVRERPRTDGGMVFDPDAATVDATWGYAYESADGAGGGGVRITLPWHTSGERGDIQLDFAYDEQLPDPPTFVAVPRGDGGPPTVVWSASRELSLTWKVQWLATDRTRDGRVAGKDLYDAVLLAELAGTWLPDRLRRRVLRSVSDPDAVRGWAVDWTGLAGHVTGGPREWLDRLAEALRHLHDV